MINLTLSEHVKQLAKLPNRIRTRIHLNEETGCWIWNGTKIDNKYGQTSLNKVKMSTHIATYKILIGPVDPSKHGHHECRNKICCNPYHILIVSRAEHENIHKNEKTNNWNKQKTHCKRGHLFDEANTIVLIRKTNGREVRYCRACIPIRNSKYA